MDQLPDPDLLRRLRPDARLLSFEILEAQLRQRLAVEQQLADLATSFVMAPDFDMAIARVLQQAGELIGAQRAYLCRLRGSGTRIDGVQEWNAPGLSPLAPHWQNLSGERMPWLFRRMSDRKVVVVEDVASLPDSAALEREIFVSQGIKSFVALPLFLDAGLVGWFGCADLACAEASGSYGGENQRVLEVIAALISSRLQREIVLETLEQRVADRTHELAALFDMTMLASQSRDLSDMLEPAINRIMEIARCQAVCIHVVSEDGGCGPHLHLLAQRGLPVANRAHLHTVWPDARFAAWLAKTGDPLLATDPGAATDLPSGLVVPGFQTFIGAQMRARGKPQGILSCYRANTLPFSWADVSMVTALAEQLGVIVENQRLRRHTEAMAVVEERQRLARELHDAVTQSLYSLTLFARSAAQAAEDGDAARLRGSLAELEASGLDALKEMRLLLYQLQPLALEDEGLVEALERRLNSVERRLGVQVQYEVTVHTDLSEHVEAEVYRIVVEALNNSLRHSGATALRVCLASEERRLQLSVADDGCGFDVAASGSGMGLENMRERSRHLGGRLDILSAPGAGTEVRFDLVIEST